MYFYAQLNENNICVGVSQLSGEVTADNMVQIESADTGYLWKKFQDNTWSTESFEPQTEAPITEFEQLKQNQALMQAALDDLLLTEGGI